MGSYDNDQSGRRDFAPVKVGDEMDVKIEAVGEKGDGLAKKDGFVLFVPNTKENQEVRVKVTRVLRSVGFAEVVGESSGPIPENTETQQPAKQQHRAPREEPAPEPEDTSQDSEDFGEEASEEKKE